MISILMHAYRERKADSVAIHQIEERLLGSRWVFPFPCHIPEPHPQARVHSQHFNFAHWAMKNKGPEWHSIIIMYVQSPNVLFHAGPMTITSFPHSIHHPDQPLPHVTSQHQGLPFHQFQDILRDSWCLLKLAFLDPVERDFRSYRSRMDLQGIPIRMKFTRALTRVYSTSMNQVISTAWKVSRRSLLIHVSSLIQSRAHFPAHNMHVKSSGASVSRTRLGTRLYCTVIYVFFK